MAGVLAIAWTEFNSARRIRQVRQQTLAIRAALAKESIQELARHYQECFPPLASTKPVNRDGAYCLEVERETDNRPLEAVSVSPAHTDDPPH